MAEQSTIEPPKVGFFVSETIGRLSSGTDLTFAELFKIQEEAAQYDDIRATMAYYETDTAEALRNASPHALQMLLINILKATETSKRYTAMPQNNRPADRVTDYSLIDYHARQLEHAHKALSARDARLKALQEQYTRNLMTNYIRMLTSFAADDDEVRSIQKDIQEVTDDIRRQSDRYTALDIERRIEAEYTKRAAATLSRLKTKHRIDSTRLSGEPYVWENGILVLQDASYIPQRKLAESEVATGRPLNRDITYQPAFYTQDSPERLGETLLAQAKRATAKQLPDYETTLVETMRAENMEWQASRAAAKEIITNPAAALTLPVYTEVATREIDQTLTTQGNISKSEAAAILRRSQLYSRAALFYDATETPADILTAPGFFQKMAKTREQKIAATGLETWIDLSGDPRTERSIIVAAALRKGLADLTGNPGKLVDALGEAVVNNREFQLVLQNSKTVFARQGSGAGGIVQGASGLLGDMAGSLFGTEFAEASLLYLAAAEGKRLSTKTGSPDLKAITELQKKQSLLLSGGVQPTNAAEALFVLTLTLTDESVFPEGGAKNAALSAFLQKVKQDYPSSQVYSLTRLPEGGGYIIRDALMLSVLSQSPDVFGKLFTIQENPGGGWIIRWGTSAFASNIRSRGIRFAASKLIGSTVKVAASGAAKTAASAIAGPVGWAWAAAGLIRSLIGGLLGGVDDFLFGGRISAKNWPYIILFGSLIPVLLVMNHAKSLTADSIMAKYAPGLGGGEEPIYCLRDDPEDSTRCIVRINGEEYSLPKALVEQMINNYNRPGVDCTQTPADPACNFTPCNPATDPAGCANPLNCPGVCISQGPAPVSGYTHKQYNENAVDLACRPYLATFTVTAGHAGRVTFVGRLGGYGNTIRLRSLDNSFETIYAHLAAYNVTVGQQVSAGAAIGSMDNTGNSTGTHLHYERRDGPDFASQGIESIDIRAMLPGSVGSCY